MQGKRNHWKTDESFSGKIKEEIKEEKLSRKEYDPDADIKKKKSLE